jgi:hypothetical protein
MLIDCGITGSALPCDDRKGRLKTTACQRERSFFRTLDMARSFYRGDEQEKKFAVSA